MFPHKMDTYLEHMLEDTSCRKNVATISSYSKRGILNIWIVDVDQPSKT